MAAPLQRRTPVLFGIDWRTPNGDLRWREEVFGGGVAQRVVVEGTEPEAVGQVLDTQKVWDPEPTVASTVGRLQGAALTDPAIEESPSEAPAPGSTDEQASAGGRRKKKKKKKKKADDGFETVGRRPGHQKAAPQAPAAASAFGTGVGLGPSCGIAPRVGSKEHEQRDRAATCLSVRAGIRAVPGRRQTYFPGDWGQRLQQRHVFARWPAGSIAANLKRWIEQGGFSTADERRWAADAILSGILDDLPEVQSPRQVDDVIAGLRLLRPGDRVDDTLVAALCTNLKKGYVWPRICGLVAAYARKQGASKEAGQIARASLIAALEKSGVSGIPV